MTAAIETKTAIQYLTNAEGEKTGVLIPIEMWEKLERLLQQQQKLQEIEDGVRESIEEYKKMKEGKMPYITMKEFLDEL